MRSSFVIWAIMSFLFIAAHARGQHTWPSKEWMVATAQSQSMNADSLEVFHNDIVAGKYGNIDGMLVTRHGKLIFRKDYTHDYDKIYGEGARKTSALNALDPGGQYNYFNPWWHPFYRRADLHTLQSVTKTITSVIIGVATARNEFPDLSTPVLVFFDTTQVKNIDDRKRKMTIRHLLTMTAGFDWNEQTGYDDPKNDCSIMEASFDWVQYVIDKPMAVEPGSTFNYNSGASELLAYIFRKATGKDIEAYAAQYLFAPLGITNYFWKRIPTGLADTEGGLYLNMADLAKIGYLFLRAGNWNGKQIVTGEWVKASVVPSVKLGDKVQYGYKWWLYYYSNNNMQYAWHGSGFGGQFPIVIPEYDIVVVFTGWNIADGMASLRSAEAIRRIVNAVADKN
jgi:CubicO group peptidase (beta-lactamase class C family)